MARSVSVAVTALAGLAGTLGLACPAALAAPLLAHAATARQNALPSVTLQTAGGPLDPAVASGQWTWLYLGYANCPDVCPTALSWLSTEYRRLKDPAAVRVVFVSVDPLRDTPTSLATYAGYFHPNFLGATGTRGAIDALASAMGARYQIPADARAGTSYPVAHTNTVFVLDPQGRLVATYTPDGDGLAQDFANGILDPTVAAPETRGAVYWCDPTQPDPLMDRARSLGSGTSLLPAESPMPMWALATGPWRWMFMGKAYGGYNLQSGPRGDLTWAAENWQMVMGSGPVGPGLLDLDLMTSLEPLTLPAGGSPELLQEGESYKFNPLIDHQHPHDLLMELAARYSWQFDARTSAFIYGGPAGEPALGPTAYMHRPSAADNPLTPLAHHLQDSTHISYGVVTAGSRRGPWQLEASLFNGKEPDENRYNLDLGPLDSASTRLSFAPDRHWVLQLSQGYLHNPERLHLGDVQRTSASVETVQDTPWGPWSSALIWGQNLEAHPPLDGLFARESYAFESQLDAFDVWHLYTRIESLDRDGLPPDPPLNHVLHRVEALTLGGVRDLGISQSFNLGLGADLTLFGLDSTLQQVYGFNPFGLRVYLRLQPPGMAHGGAPGPMAGHGG